MVSDVTPTGWTGHAVKIQELMGGLGYALSSWDKPMLDQTGLTGYYDLSLSLIKQERGPTLEQQVEEQLGLRLDARNVPITTFVIDSVEKPTLDAASATVPAPVATPAPPPPPHIHFDVVSWKRCDPNAVKGSNRVDLPVDSDFVAYHCQSIYRIIYFAFSGPAPVALAGSAPFHLSGHPSWVDDDLYEFQAKVAPDDIAAWKAMNINDKRIAVRDILADQLKLHIHVDKTPQPAYALMVAKGGAKLTEYKVGEQWKLPDGRILQGRAQEYFDNVGYLQNSTMNNFAADLSVRLDRPVFDQTGLTGSYDISLPLTKATGADPFANIGDGEGNIKAKLSRLQELGARGGVVYSQQDWGLRLREAAGAGFDAAIDSWGAEGWADVLRSLRWGGVLVSFGDTGGEASTIPVAEVYWAWRSIVGTTMGSPGEYRALLDHVREHAWRPVIDSVHALEDLDSAARRLLDRDRFGKIVLHVSDPP